jgi:hypothetical protein
MKVEIHNNNFPFGGEGGWCEHSLKGWKNTVGQQLHFEYLNWYNGLYFENFEKFVFRLNRPKSVVLTSWIFFFISAICLKMEPRSRKSDIRSLSILPDRSKIENFFGENFEIAVAWLAVIQVFYLFYETPKHEKDETVSNYFFFVRLSLLLFWLLLFGSRYGCM